MKGQRRIILCLWIFGLLAGCAAAPTESGMPSLRNVDTPQIQNGTAETVCAGILINIWEQYTTGEHFLAFGGDPEKYVPQGPGDLDVLDTTMLQHRFFLPEDLCGKVAQGAALEHLLNRNVFCAGVFQVTEKTDPVQMALQWEKEFQKHQWPGSQPQRYLIAQPEPGFLLIAYGQTRVLETFLIRMNQAYPKGQILMYQEIPQKIAPQGLQKANSEAIAYLEERFWIHLPRLMT